MVPADGPQEAAAGDRGHVRPAPVAPAGCAHCGACTAMCALPGPAARGPPDYVPAGDRSPTEPFCAAVRKVTPPLFGVDISPVRLAVRMHPATPRALSLPALSPCACYPAHCTSCRHSPAPRPSPPLCPVRPLDCNRHFLLCARAGGALRGPELRQRNLLGAAGCPDDDGGQVGVGASAGDRAGRGADRRDVGSPLSCESQPAVLPARCSRALVSTL
jgi:hypothetical protein